MTKHFLGALTTLKYLITKSFGMWITRLGDGTQESQSEFRQHLIALDVCWGVV